MTTKQREDLRKKAGSLGLSTSTQDSRVQFENSRKVIHQDDNRTQIGGTLYHGYSDAKKALDKLKDRKG